MLREKDNEHHFSSSCILSTVDGPSSCVRSLTSRIIATDTTSIARYRLLEKQNQHEWIKQNEQERLTKPLNWFRTCKQHNWRWLVAYISNSIPAAIRLGFGEASTRYRKSLHGWETLGTTVQYRKCSCLNSVRFGPPLIWDKIRSGRIVQCTWVCFSEVSCIV